MINYNWRSKSKTKTFPPPNNWISDWFSSDKGSTILNHFIQLFLHNHTHTKHTRTHTFSKCECHNRVRYSRTCPIHNISEWGLPVSREGERVSMKEIVNSCSSSSSCSLLNILSIFLSLPMISQEANLETVLWSNCNDE